jgi:hypothetical protein
VTGLVVIGSLAGVVMNIAVVPRAALLGRAVDTVLAYAREEVPVGEVTRGRPADRGHAGHRGAARR